MRKYDVTYTPPERTMTEKDFEEERKAKERKEAWDKKSDFEKQNELPF